MTSRSRVGPKRLRRPEQVCGACKSGAMDTSGTLALVGGDEWTEGCPFDPSLLAASGGTEVMVLPTAAAYQHPERVVLRAAEWFEPLGGQGEGRLGVGRA